MAKSLAQVGRAKDSLVASDADVFDKWSQSLASADDLMHRCYWEGGHETNGTRIASTVVPAIVVPDGRLWSVEYSSSGERLSDPVPVAHRSFYVGKTYSMEKLTGASLTISHLEIFTFSGLASFITDTLRSSDGMAAIFPRDEILAELKKRVRS